MMVLLAMVIGEGRDNDNEGCSDNIDDDDNGRFDRCLVRREMISL